MLGRNDSQPALFQMVDLEALVPANHRLRKLDAVLDLSFVPEAVASCYSAGRGRPSIDPELVIRMLVLGTLYNFSDRELCEEIGMHVGMRWFCRLNLHDPVPDHSTLSKLKERWAEAGVFEKVFDQVVRQCAEAGLVSGRHISVDGTQVQANASMKSLATREPAPDIAAAPQPHRSRRGTRTRILRRTVAARRSPSPEASGAATESSTATRRTVPRVIPRRGSTARAGAKRRV